MDTILKLDPVFQLVGILIVYDILVTWFNSGFPAVFTRLLWKLGYRKNDPEFWPDDIRQAETWTKDGWLIWVNLTFPTLGELLTCPICLSRHVSWITCLVMWVVLQPSWHNLIGILFWPAIASTLHKRL